MKAALALCVVGLFIGVTLALLEVPHLWNPTLFVGYEVNPNELQLLVGQGGYENNE